LAKFRAGRCILEHMKGEGVKYFFGIPGGGIAPFFNEFYDFPDIRVILVKHEQGASFMADGYYRASHVVAACGGTVGPGGMNIISGLHVPYQDSIPVLAITNNVPTTSFGKADIQDACGWGPRALSHVDAAKPVTKWSVLVFNAKLVPEVIRRAFRIMLADRKGPVLIDLCQDIIREEIETEILPPEKYRPFCKIRGDRETTEKAAELLVKASRPAILAGGGVQYSDAQPELFELANLLSIPVATTLMGKSSFPEDHPLALGVAGREGSDVANQVLTTDRTDLLLAIGCMFHAGTTRGWRSNFGGRRLIHVDIDPMEIGKNYPVDVGIIGDSKTVLRDLIDIVRIRLSKMKKEELEDLEVLKQERTKEILQLKGELKYYSEPEMFSDAVPIKPQRACKEIRESADRNAIFFCDCGNNLAWAERYIQAYGPPRTFLVDGGHTAMGFSLAASIGAKLGAPNKQVIDIIGNGSFQMLCKEVITAASYNIPVIWCILDDQNLGRIKHGQKFGYKKWDPERYIATSSYDLDFEKFAEACRVFGRKVERPGEIKDALNDAKASGKPAIIDIRIDPDEVPPVYLQENEPVIQKYSYLLKKKMPVPTWPRPYETPL